MMLKALNKNEHWGKGVVRNIIIDPAPKSNHLINSHHLNFLFGSTTIFFVFLKCFSIKWITVKNTAALLTFIFLSLTTLLSFTAQSQSFVDIQARLSGVSESSSGWIDYDEDGDLDVFVSGDFYVKNGHYIKTKMYRNARNDQFPEVFPALMDVYRGDFDWADYDLDGIDDLFLIGETNSGDLVAYLYKNSRSLQFTRIPLNIPGLRDGSVEWGDYDGDGDPDLLMVGDSKAGAVSKVFRNDRGNRFTDTKALLPGIHHGVGRWADYDLDGDLDIILSGTASSGMVITELFRNDKGAFVRVKMDFINLRLSDIAWGDYDNDGDLDFAIIGETQGNSYVSRLYRNDKNGYFSLAFPNFINVRSGSVDWGDFDHDGDLDLLLTGESVNGPVSKVYRNDRNEWFTDIHADIIGLYMSDGHWGDYDNDGDLDVLVSGMSNQYDFIARIYRNDPIRRDTVESKEEDIWNNSVVVSERPKKIYYYTYASCYCDLDLSGKKSYHAFISPIKKPTVQYELERQFNETIMDDFPNWYEFDQGNLITNGFSNLQKAEESKRIAIREYQSKGFVVHELSW